MAASNTIDSFRHSISSIFHQAQFSMANHHKNCISLYKLHMRTVGLCNAATSKTARMYKEAFDDVFIDMISRVLPVKSGSPTAERVIKFIRSYVRLLLEKDEGEGETFSANFMLRLIRWLLEGFSAKDTTVRYRAVSLVQILVIHLKGLDEDTYNILCQSMIERSRDKESNIRVSAIAALSKLVIGEEPVHIPEDQPSIMEIMLESLCYDPSPEVRHATLQHIPVIARTLPVILTRSRDVDPSVRKLLFSAILSSAIGRSKYSTPDPTADFLLYPQQLTLAQREKVVREGLDDKDASVQVAAAQMLAEWFDNLRQDGDNVSVTDKLLEFARLFDVAAPEGIDIVDRGMRSLFDTNPDILREVHFDAKYWNMLTPESAFLTRVFLTHCRENNKDALLDSAGFPDVTTLAYYLQDSFNALLDAMEEIEDARLTVASGRVDGDDDGDEELDRKEDAVLERTVVAGELLRTMEGCDFADETGRRKVFAVVREMLAHDSFPEGLMDPCMDVLKATAPSERELIRIVVEIVTELRDPVDDYLNDGASTFRDRRASLASTSSSQSSVKSLPLRPPKSRSEMTAKERTKADATDMRCLALCNAMLSRMNGTFDENSTLGGVLADLILPSVNSTELHVRERGVITLGLCGLIAKELAMSSFQLLLNEAKKSPESLKIKILHVIFDFLSVHDQELLFGSKEKVEKVICFLLQTLENEESSAVQAVACLGISKLMLSKRITDERVLTSLLLAFISPMSAANPTLKQCLEYFLPAYCYSSRENQSRMQTVAMAAYDQARRIYEVVEEDDDVITPYQFGLCLVEWTDPRQLNGADEQGIGEDDTHLHLAVDFLQGLYETERTDEDRKTICQLLENLYLPNEPAELPLLLLNVLLQDIERDAIREATTKKLVDQFRSRFMKRYRKRVEQLDPTQYQDNATFRKMCTHIKRHLKQVISPITGNPDDDKENDDATPCAVTPPRKHPRAAKRNISPTLPLPSPARKRAARHQE
ncbi:uncharacterized protein LAESUDRAFT_689301 [Laetiporus sulphureus 93-53]|uniref:Nuclear condensin complex subunit 3 C-terminal domain-containing protein n=1 Tax=Laetiporus sulphureus 93-53 TaxID=1314785 RepID=A0A165I5C0_9APHY|nr:uncharacterized protein LAESUDRAFT_689301 [Laetiporus sulphureus 93-53]KZT12609.1 hypothetical protein LAESUDRAFT_689301 [Laetiporus sulphureus 93-53]